MTGRKAPTYLRFLVLVAFGVIVVSDVVVVGVVVVVVVVVVVDDEVVHYSALVWAVRTCHNKCINTCSDTKATLKCCYELHS